MKRLEQDKKKICEVSGLFYRKIEVILQADKDRHAANSRNQQNLAFLRFMVWQLSILALIAFSRFFCLELWDVAFSPKQTD